MNNAELLDQLIEEYLRRNGMLCTLSVFNKELNRSPANEELKEDLIHLEDLVCNTMDHSASNDEPYANFLDGFIQSATCSYLTSNLLAYNRDMLSFIPCFCCMYRSFSDCEYVVRTLIETVKQASIQTRVPTIAKFFIIMVYWMSKYPSDFSEREVEHLQEFKEWYRDKRGEKEDKNYRRFSSGLVQIVKHLNKIKRSSYADPIPIKNPSIHTLPLLSPQRIAFNGVEIFDIHPVEISRQMTLLYYEYFSQSDVSQLIHTVWDKKTKFYDPCTQISKLLKYNANFRSWIATSIRNEVMGDRMRTVLYFMRVLHCFIVFNNVYGAITMYEEVQTLTDEIRSKTIEEQYELIEENMRLARMLSHESKYNRFYDVKSFKESPIVPHIEHQIRNLEVLREEHKDKGIIFLGKDNNRKEITLINWTYLNKIFPLVNLIERYQIHNRENQRSYSFAKVPQLQKAILSAIQQC